MTTPWQRAERDLGLPGLVEALAVGQASQVTSVLLEVARRRAEAREPAGLLRQHRDDAFVQPCDLDLRTFLALDHAIAEAVPDADLVALSPVAPLGTCTAVAPGSQNRVLSATRNTEVVADPTNALALIAADRRSRGEGRVRLGTVHRTVRAQRPGNPAFRQHFHLWVFLSAGRDPGGRTFEREEIAWHLDAVGRVLAAARAVGHAVPDGALRVLVRPDLRAAVEAVTPPGTAFHDAPPPYYDGLRFQIDVPAGDGVVPLVDGGLVDWVARLTSDRKEKCVVSAVGTELIARLWPRR